MSSMTRGMIIRYGLIVAIIVVLLFPVYWMALTAVLPTRELLSPSPPLIPDLSSISFDSFQRVFELRPVGRWMTNSAVVTAGTVVCSVVLATMAGYSLSRLASKIGLVVGYSLFAVRLIPTTLLVIPLFMMFSEVELNNTLRSLVIANTVVIVPFAAWLMKSFFDSIPVELEEAAMVDGCSRLRSFLTIVLPLARPGIGAVAIFSGILAWGDFTFARTLIQGDAGTTVTVGLVSFVGEYTADWGALMAAGLLSIAPMVVLFILLEPLLISGLTSGAVK
ncbi:carbohydrate ABC transporter permease [Jiangella ureilytica]|uniref:Carbohydrate ABC transporter permease n=2 Tax=Jiangella ureilytica TaxID=2530374 RepID=A0A4V2XWS3_9ACTN|nr:carbohydrate ABC transporter permease [Jiangella ureilytica]